jgi:hypothetical protein
MRPAAVHALLALLLLAGCSDPPSEASEDGASPTPQGSSSNSTTDDVGSAPAEAKAGFNGTFSLTVTYASPAQGLGTNFGQENCIQFEAVTMQNGTATLTWTAGPGSDQLELVIRAFQNANGEGRMVGSSPLVMPFQFPLGSSPIIFSVQSVPMGGAVTQLPVQLDLGFQHPVGESPAAEPRLCAF